MYIVYIHGTQISTSIFWKSGPQENKTSTPTKRKKHERVPGIYIYILFIHIYIDPFMVHVPSPILVDPGISSHSEAPALCPRPQLPKNFNGWWVKSSPLFFFKGVFFLEIIGIGRVKFPWRMHLGSNMGGELFFLHMFCVFSRMKRAVAFQKTPVTWKTEKNISKYFTNPKYLYKMVPY